MNVLILTFHFAHNYGAVLQAYGLKKYLEENEHCKVNIIGYVPQKAKKDYTLNPLANGMHLRSVIKNVQRIPHRIRQFRLFESFIKSQLSVIKEKRELSEVLDKTEMVFFGSDQIWNTDITGKIGFYYGDFVPKGIEKVSYAASFGKNVLNDFERSMVNKYLINFDAISVRENKTTELLGKFSLDNVEAVCDPVFLIDKEEWIQFAQDTRVRVTEPYVLYYSLKENTELIAKMQEVSKKNGMNVIAIHPTAVKQKTICKQLYNVGPREFVWLISHADTVCTNSFHASAFSVIFRRKLLFYSHSDNESRVSSMLDTIFNDDGNNSIKQGEIIDLTMVDGDRLNAWIQKSKDFISLSLKKGSIKS